MNCYRFKTILTNALLLFFIISFNPSFGAENNRGNVTDERVINSPAEEPGSWLTYGQNFKEQRFSELTQINTDTIDQLGLAWTKQIGDYNMRMQGTPIVVDGVMYVTNGWSVIYALNATTGK